MTEQMWSLARVSAFLGVAEPSARQILNEASVPAHGPGQYRPVDVAAFSESQRLDHWSKRSGWTVDYQRDGFIVLRSRVDAETLAGTVEAIYQVRPDTRGRGPELVRGPSGKLLRINGLEKNTTILPLVQSLRLEAIAAELIVEPVLYRVSLVCRGYDNPPELGAHRDPRWTARQRCEPVCAFGLTLHRTIGEPGDVYYQPGTHRLGADGIAAPAVRAPDIEVLPSAFPGDVVLHNLGVVHGATRYLRPQNRATLYCSFASRSELSAT